MKRNLLLAFVSMLSVSPLFAQEDPVLLRIDGQPITRSEFEYIYNKHNSQNVLDKKTLPEYMELFINYKLKVNEAVQQGLDTTMVFKDELHGYRMQVAQSYLSDEAAEQKEIEQLYAALKDDERNHRIQIQQVLLRLPQNLSKAQVRAAEQRMDSIYKAIQQADGVNFEAMVRRFSDDKKTQIYSPLQLTEDFADVVFATPVGQITAPFSTAHGLHIVKVLDKGALISFEEFKNDFQLRAQRRDGFSYATRQKINHLLNEYKYTPNDVAVEELYSAGSTDKVLFYLDGQPYDGALFRQFAQYHPMQLKKQYRMFVDKSVLDYENSRLETKYPEFAMLMQEYHDGILLFDVSTINVWDKAQEDVAGQAAYFAAHEKNYKWELPRFKGVVVHCADRKTMKLAKKQLRKLPKPLTRQAVESLFNTSSGATVQVEEGLFAVGENPYVDHAIFKVAPKTSLPDYPFTYVYGDKRKGPDDFRQVKGLVVADYQDYLEQVWVKDLRSKSKVEINQEVLKTVNKY